MARLPRRREHPAPGRRTVLSRGHQRGAIATDGHETKRELIQLALEALGPIDDERTRWATRRVIVRMARMARDAHRDDRSVGRETLRTQLEEITATARALRRKLDGTGVGRALSHAQAVRDDSIDTVEVYAALNELPDTLRALPHSLHILEVSATAAVDKLRLVGRRGNVTPWQTSTATAKVRLAACGLRVFQAVRGLKRLPGDKNEGLHGFLAWVWEAATGEVDAHDWTTPVRTARGKRLQEGTEVAIYSSMLDARTLIKAAARWERGRH